MGIYFLSFFFYFHFIFFVFLFFFKFLSSVQVPTSSISPFGVMMVFLTSQISYQ